VIAILLTVVLAATGGAPTLPDIEDEVMCVICGTALNVSGAPAAERQREFIRRRIADGLDKEQIKDALVAEYGPDVLAVPEDGGGRIGSLIVPALAVVLGLGGVVALVRRGRGNGGGPPEDAAPPPELDPRDAARLDADLAAFDR
jgi:cytochrome c-type biogenesis protein CcmH